MVKLSPDISSLQYSGKPYSSSTFTHKTTTHTHSGLELLHMQQHREYHMSYFAHGAGGNLLHTLSTFASICCNNSFLTEIWLVGSSLIYWAHRRAVARPVGLDLGLQKYGLSLTWYGSRGMKWKSLLPFLQQKLRRSPPPAWLLLHLGGNDLGDVPTTVLLQTVSRDLTKIHHMMPFTQVIWSDVLQRVTWRGIPDGRVMERKRKRFNRFGRKGVLDLGGSVLGHNEINIADRGLFRQDGVHLSDIGNDIFVNSLQGGLELFAGLSSSRCSFQN
ncbi:uncharacterized protein LOC125376902 [Haliotis rufescens]|uniref:uncharacterized protein LOC125376902 n=1 Tax=Haliotis rufescens TaxID=6454 RepID=UPI00201ECD08|nr:uncharacterized protein LOC125376902 [Haliotis rufescens]